MQLIDNVFYLFTCGNVAFYPLKNKFAANIGGLRRMKGCQICEQLTNGPTVMIFPEIASQFFWYYFIIIRFVYCDRDSAYAVLFGDLPNWAKNARPLTVTPDLLPEI